MEEENKETRFSDPRSYNLATKPVGKLLLEYATPSIIAMSASSIYNLCDSIFIGHGAGPLAIAGLALTFPLMNISSAFGAMMGVGSGALASIRMGENNQKAALIVFGNMLRMNVTVGLIITVLGLIFLDPLLRLFGASENTLPYARDYMQIILLGNVITHTFLGMNDQMRSTGHPKKAMTAQLIAVFANIVMDALFIFGFGWGMRGAALATVLGQLLAFLYEVHHFWQRENFVHFSKFGLIFNGKVIREIIAIGMSPFFINVCGCIVVIFINRALMEQGGADGDRYVGVYGIVNRISMLAFLMALGFSQGLRPIVGFNLGARLYTRVSQALWHAYGWATGIMAAGYLLIALFPRQLAMMFTSDTAMLDASVPALRIMLMAFPVVGGQIIITAFFQSVREAKTAVFLSTTRQLLFLLPLLLVLPPLYGVYGVWWTHPIADVISAVLSNWLLIRYINKMKKTIR